MRNIGIDGVEACADLARHAGGLGEFPESRQADALGPQMGGGPATHFGVVHTRREIKGTGQVAPTLNRP